MPVRPMLGELDLVQVQRIVVDDTEVFAAHAAAGVDADYLQRLSHRSATIRLSGVVSGERARRGLADLRARFRDAEPVAFAADVATATRVDQVLVEELAVREVAGRPERFEYAVTLRHYLPPPAPQTRPVAPPAAAPPLADPEQATLVVQVEAPGRPDLDPATVTVQAQPADAGEIRTLSTRAGNRWTGTGLPAATWTVTATAPGGPTATGTATTAGGQTAQLTLTLAAATQTAEAFLVTFRFDKAFVEPCMRPVLRAVAQRAARPGQHLLVLGHTDHAGPDAYNTSLGQRRVDAVLAYLTAGRDPGAALATWRELRLPRPAADIDSPHDSWGLREAQQMLQDLGRYPGAIDGRDGPLTQDAVQATRCAAGLPPGTLDDAAWDALITQYLGQDALAVADTSLVKDAGGSTVRGASCGETHPLPLPQPSKAGAHRPYRRVELIFTPTDTLPAGVAPCDAVTWDPAQATGSRLLVQPAEPATLTLQGTISRLVRNPDGTTALRPAAGVPFVVVTPDGAFLRGEQGSGEPIAARTDGQGTFAFPGVRAGWFGVEVRLDPPVLARLAAEPDSAARGPSVCAHLAADGERLDIVLLPDAVRRQLRLPVVVHLMTMLDPATHAVRPCPVLNRAGPVPQRSVLTADQARSTLAAANTIWAPARIAFDLVHVVSEVSGHPDRPAGEVDTDEIGLLIMGAAYPDVVNIFEFAVVKAGEAGVHLPLPVTDPATGQDAGIADGIGVGDLPVVELFGKTSAPVPFPLTDAGRAVVFAHELGHYLSLPHAEGARARPHQLMLPTADDDHTEILEPAETTLARGSRNAVDCRPVRLEVSGAQPVGGTAAVPSGQFVAIPDPAGTVTLTARITPALLAAGTLTWVGGVAGAGPTERTVPRVTGSTRVQVTYTPAGGGRPTSTFARVLVTELTLAVTGATRVGGPAGTTFVARPDPAGIIAIDAVLDRRPEVTGPGLVAWTGGAETVDPLRRTLSRAAPVRAQVTATLAGSARTVTIIVFDLALVRNLAPFTVPVADVLLEGLVNDDLKDVRLAAVVPGQQPSTFRARAVVPGVVAGTLPATLTSTAADGTTIETVPLTLTRQGGDVFVSVPILAIPAVIPRADLTFHRPRDLELVRAASGGRLTLRIDGLFAVESVQAAVHARVLHLDIQVFTGSGPTVADVTGTHLPLARRAWAQAGIEVTLRGAVTEVAPPAGLLSIDHTDDTGKNLTGDEKRLVGQVGPSPRRSGTATDLNVYYLRAIGRAGGARGGGTVHGIAYPAFPVIALAAAATSTALTHEIGHQLKQTHHDPGGADWPEHNVMHPEDTGAQRDLDREQMAALIRLENAQDQLRRKGTPPAVPLQPYLVREP